VHVSSRKQALVRQLAPPLVDSESTMVSAPDETVGNSCLRHWRQASLWRKLVERELAPLRLSLIQWIVLDATLRLVRRAGDAVNQNQVARQARLERMVVSNAMWALDQRNFVSRGPDFIGPGLRVFVTEEGVKAIAQGRARIEAASRAWKRTKAMLGD
jgi:DNA-binding MarR family transcriptional regulator